MGDRANVCVKNPDPYKPSVFFYTHSDGYQLPELMAIGLERASAAGRLKDYPYLCRILFCQLIRDDRDGTTGYGIDTDIGDNEHPILVIDPGNRIVGIAKQNEPRIPYAVVPIETFIHDHEALPYRHYRADGSLRPIE